MKLFELAERLGMTVRELSLRLDSRELSEWIVWDNRIKISDADIQTARVTYTLACCHSDPKKRKPRFKDFLPDRRSKLAMSGEEILAAMKEAFGQLAIPTQP